MTIDCGGGAVINCNTSGSNSTLQLKTLLDAFKTFVEKNGTLEAERILDKLNEAPYLKSQDY
jgi:hypothetical protein